MANPFAGQTLYLDEGSLAMRAYERLLQNGSADADVISRIAFQPQAVWLRGDGIGVARDVVQRVQQTGEYPVFVVYNIPRRDNGGASSGGAAGDEAYRQWIDDLVGAIDSVPSAIILEPDALAHDGRESRYDLIFYAVTALVATGQTAVYIDAGHSNWHPARRMAEFLERAGVAEADGFALNVSNFRTTRECIRFGKQISALTGGKPFVVDTSRNGSGPDAGNEWSNPPGRAIGPAPTANTGDPLVHAFLWVKRPGESDGPRNGGFAAGDWYERYALDLCTNVATG